ncbi:DegV family protein [Streptococcus sciuri]|uniref:DegV family protein n=1 Tax=Streptococcus sciuri TaxID=2973939 RepID=A0ABT2F746_9STRE|nr:DegV family protein [Streptococcus sciuri]MCS4488282.1 DegV family protein [Streptococcus sciuri]
MKLAIITDNTAVLPQEVAEREDVFILDIPITIDGATYVEGKNLTISEFYAKMATSKTLPKTSQPSLADLEEILSEIESAGFTHVIGLFLSSGISGFWQNIQFLIDEYKNMTIAFPDSHITSYPLGRMVINCLRLADEGVVFETILKKLAYQIDKTQAYIVVDDLNHFVKGGRLSNGAAMLGNLLSIKPLLYFDDEGKIIVYEKVRTEKKIMKRMLAILEETTAASDHDYDIFIIEGHALDKAKRLRVMLADKGYNQVDITSFGSVIATHLGEGAICFGVTPRI